MLQNTLCLSVDRSGQSVGICGRWKNSAFYNHLSKGTYTFQVKATDENGLWSKEVTELTIRRLPAFMKLGGRICSMY